MESPYKRKEGYKNIVQFDENGYPSCEKHGAMTCVNKQRLLWRCVTCGVGVSFEHVNVFDEWIRRQKQRTKLGIERISVQRLRFKESLVGMPVRIVADDFKGYGTKTKYVDQKGKIIGWRKWKHGDLPVIQLDSGEILSRRSIWWTQN